MIILKELFLLKVNDNLSHLIFAELEETGGNIVQNFRRNVLMDVISDDLSSSVVSFECFIDIAVLEDPS